MIHRNVVNDRKKAIRTGWRETSMLFRWLHYSVSQVPMD